MQLLSVKSLLYVLTTTNMLPQVCNWLMYNNKTKYDSIGWYCTKNFLIACWLYTDTMMNNALPKRTSMLANPGTWMDMGPNTLLYTATFDIHSKKVYTRPLESGKLSLYGIHKAWTIKQFWKANSLFHSLLNLWVTVDIIIAFTKVAFFSVLLNIWISAVE